MMTNQMPSLWGAVVTLLIFSAATVATWLQSGVISVAHSDVTKHLGYSYHRISSAVEAVHEHSGQYPQSLAELPESLMSDDVRVDPWGRPYEFNVTEDSFRLESRGRDGVPGGVGIDTDWSLGPDDSVRGVEIPVPFRQFVLDTPSARSAFLFSVVSSLIAGHMIRSEARASSNRYSQWFSVITIIVITTAITTFLAMFHIAASQSRH